MFGKAPGCEKSCIEVGGTVRDLHRGKGPILVQALIASGDTPHVLPTCDGHSIKPRFAVALAA
jgi:hypothetical protein